ncbi:MAG: hypothetical protein IKO96_04100 [Spirochaetales bacterium]|nr:hypothetical protein [Spirochaetales bacterium]
MTGWTRHPSPVLGEGTDEQRFKLEVVMTAKSNTYCPDRLQEVKILLGMLRQVHITSLIKETEFMKNIDGWQMVLPEASMSGDAGTDSGDACDEDDGFFWDDIDVDIDDDAMEWDFDFND